MFVAGCGPTDALGPPEVVSPRAAAAAAAYSLTDCGESSSSLTFHFLLYCLHVDFGRLAGCSSRSSGVMFTCTQD